MQSQAEILREALALSSEARADIAAELIASLDASEWERPADVELAWAREIERRLQRLRSGEATTEAWESVRERLSRRFQ